MKIRMMGKKGAKLSELSFRATQELLDRLQGIEGITSKKMFGGHGIFHDDRMFAMVTSKGEYYLKSNVDTRADFEANNGVKHSRMPYYSLPDVIIEDHDQFLFWVQKSIESSKSNG